MGLATEGDNIGVYKAYIKDVDQAPRTRFLKFNTTLISRPSCSGQATPNLLPLPPPPPSHYSAPSYCVVAELSRRRTSELGGVVDLL